MNLQLALLLLPGLIIGLTVHEAAHAITAKWLGDRTSEKMGRVSLNPLRHLSLYGTLALFVLHFGWGKPVIVNLYNFKKPKFYYLLSSLAGPVSNLLICGICLAVLYMHPPQIIDAFLRAVFFINGMLAAINMVPIPPLDGSKIWPCLIPGMKPTISGKWSMVWMAVLLVGLYTGTIGKVLDPIQETMWQMLPDNSPYVTDRPDNFPEELVVPENATNVYYYDRKQDKRRGKEPFDYTLGFSLSDQPEVDNAYVYIEKRLTSHNWRKLKYLLFEPKVENNGQWHEQNETPSEIHIKMRYDYWVNYKNELIGVNYTSIEYLDKSNDDDNMFHISRSKPPEKPDSLINNYKQLHPEEFVWETAPENNQKSM